MTPRDPVLKAAALAALLQGQSITSVSKEYKIPLGTLSSWKRRASTIHTMHNEEQKKEIGELLIEYLRANLATLQEQVKMFADRQWLAKQNAADVAVLHGVMTDKAIRLLEALSNVPGNTNENNTAED